VGVLRGGMVTRGHTSSLRALSPGETFSRFMS
jgi:hypothetical protein